MTGDDAGDAQTALAERWRVALSRPIFMDQMWQIGASIGLAQAPDDGTQPRRTDAPRRAGAARRQAQQAAASTVRFEPQIETEYDERRFIAARIASRDRGAARSTCITSRSSRPTAAASSASRRCCAGPIRCAAPIAPAVFIPLAEQTGLMSQLGEFVLRRALADGARWPNLFVAVNLSPVQIRDPRAGRSRRRRHGGEPASRRRASCSKSPKAC